MAFWVTLVSPVLAATVAPGWGHMSVVGARASSTNGSKPVLASELENRASQTIPVSVAVLLGHPTVNVSPTLFGQFFEEINQAGTGGIDAELVSNRAFEAGGQQKRRASFRLLDGSGFFLRVDANQLYAAKVPLGTEGDATFSMVPSFAKPADKSFTSLESVTNRNNFLRLDNTHVVWTAVGTWATPTEAIRNDTTFRVVIGRAGNNTVSFESVSRPGYYLAADPQSCAAAVKLGSCYDITLSNTALARLSSFEVVNGLQLPSYAPWSSVGGAVVLLSEVRPLNNASTWSLYVNASQAGQGVANPGFWGMNLQAAQSYELSFFAYAQGLSSLRVQLIHQNGDVLAETTIAGLSSSWHRFAAKLTPTQSSTGGSLRFLSTDMGSFWLDVVSLVPSKTWNNHGFRYDLATMLDDMAPKFIRFPGGCYVEGIRLQDMFNWRNALGSIEERKGHWNHVWNYWSDDGLGLYEYLQLCEDLGAVPIWVVNNGISHTQEVTGADLEPFIANALDSLEFAMGDPATSSLAALRAKMGHPKPFRIPFVAVGNEGNIGGPDYGAREHYFENYVAFYKALKQRYPSLSLVANMNLQDWHGRSAPTDVYDFHVYSNPQWFIDNMHIFDSADRAGPRIFVSEYAVTDGCGQGNLRAAVAEAAFMTGLERNSDVVTLASYAPLFVNVNNKAWNPDTIVFNSYQVYGTPSYHVQKLFAQNSLPGASVRSVVVDVATAQLAISATADAKNTTAVLKIVNYGGDTYTLDIEISGRRVQSASGQVLSSPNLDDENSFAQPTKVAPVAAAVTVTDSGIAATAVPYSVNIFKLTLV